MNEKFNPDKHFALFQIPDPSKPSGTVASVVKVCIIIKILMCMFFPVQLNLKWLVLRVLEFDLLLYSSVFCRLTVLYSLGLFYGHMIL